VLLHALAAFWRGSLGSEYAILSGTLVRATPLLLTGLAVAVAFRAGVFNIGADGQFLAGATAAATIGWLGAGWPDGVQRFLGVPLIIVAGAGVGAAWAGIAAWLRRRFGVLEVISTLMLNFIALDAVAYLVRGPLQEPSRVYPQTSELAAGWHLPKLVPATRLHAGFALALIVAIVAAWIVRSTAGGFRMRVVGANPWAAASAGRIDVPAVTTRVFLVSGALAGVAGAVELTGVTFSLYDNISPGYGYTAIAVALLAGLRPLGVIATSILFGALEAGAAGMQRDAGVPAVVAMLVEALLVLTVLAVEARRRLTPDHTS
jgi:simple sugar transport system permease protein